MWRTGLNRVSVNDDCRVYLNDIPVCMAQTPELAAEMVKGLNAAEKLAEALKAYTDSEEQIARDWWEESKDWDIDKLTRAFENEDSVRCSLWVQARAALSLVEGEG